ncbi:MAG: hypothetical protein Q8T11_07725 [Elusimicrobiota bacterium]|nr:hypothetical protein [Elusimicrobiota bacterium]
MAEGPFAEVEALLAAGEAGAARGALARARGGEAWEAELWRGRIAEKEGRLDEAERAYREAARADVKAAPELDRLLEEEKYAAHREARLAEALRTKAGRERIEAEVREGLASAPVPGAPLEALIRLIEARRFSPALERALLGAVARAGDGDKLAGEWPQLFSALMCAGRYVPAFRLGEAVLDRFGRFESPGQLMWPWWRRIRRAVAEEAFLRRELARVRAAAAAGALPHWFSYYRAILLSNLARNKAAMAEYAKLKALDADRYSWMWQSFVLVKLGVLDFPGAVAISRDILSRAPSHWWVRCRMAEAIMAGGDAAGGLREFEEAERTCGPGALGEVLTWHGEVLLWLGEYDRALGKLDAAVAEGAKTFVFGWRGAVHLKRGDHARALADLDAAVARDPKDFEARGWRAEAHRLAGRHGEASADLEHLVVRGPKNFWTHINRALLRDAAGDVKGMAEDFAQAPPELLALARARLGAPRAEMRRALTSWLDWAKGVRRWEKYVQPIWMERIS